MEIRSDFPDLIIPDNITAGQLLLDRCRLHGNSLALIDGCSGNKILFNDIVDYVELLMLSFHKLGVTQDQTVMLCMNNCLEYVYIFLALTTAGITVTDVNPAFTEYEMGRQIEASKPSVMIVDDGQTDKAQQLQMRFTYIKTIITLGPPKDELLSLSMLLRSSGRSATFPQASISTKRMVALLTYTSGTTGLPKAAQLSHFNLVANILQMTSPAQVAIHKGGVYVATFPIHHAAGKIILATGLYVGATVVVRKQFDYHKFLDDNIRYSATVLSAPPPILQRLAQDGRVYSSKLFPNQHIPHTEARYDLKHIQTVIFGAAAMSKELLVVLRDKLGCPSIVEGYGLTESTATSLLNPLRDPCIGSVGKLLPNTHAKIIGLSTDESLGPDKRGELCIKGPQVMLGYKDLPEQTAETLDSDGWLHTGDVAYYNHGKYFFIVGRLKEVIKVKGFQVFPAELEQTLLLLDGVTDAAVVGVPDQQAGELPRAYVVRVNDNVTKERVHYHMSVHLAPYKQLRGGIHFVPLIPKSASGKTLRNKLSDFKQLTSKI